LNQASMTTHLSKSLKISVCVGALFHWCPVAMAGHNTLLQFSAVEPFWWFTVAIFGAIIVVMISLFYRTVNGYINAKKRCLETDRVVSAMERLLPNLDKEQRASLITNYLVQTIGQAEASGSKPITQSSSSDLPDLNLLSESKPNNTEPTIGS
jgi:hypothetical protein